MNELEQQIAALIFVAEQAISFNEIVSTIARFQEEDQDEEVIEQAIQQVRMHYEAEDSPFELTEMSGGYQFLTKAPHHKLLSIFINTKQKRRLSKAALETLSIIAYSQPVSKGEVERIRGVSCDYSVQKLLERELIEIKGRSDGPGRPLLYGVGEVFLDYFGIRSTDDLPKLQDIAPAVNEIGENAEDYDLDTPLQTLKGLMVPDDGPKVVRIDGEERVVEVDQKEKEASTGLRGGLEFDSEAKEELESRQKEEQDKQPDESDKSTDKNPTADEGSESEMDAELDGERIAADEADQPDDKAEVKPQKGSDEEEEFAQWENDSESE